MSHSKNSHPPTPSSAHGPKTQAAIAKQAKSHANEEGTAGPREVPDGEIKDEHDKELAGELHTGKHRLVENRVQHDDADKASDKNRLSDDAKKHKHGNPGGKLNGGPTHQ